MVEAAGATTPTGAGSGTANKNLVLAAMAATFIIAVRSLPRGRVVAPEEQAAAAIDEQAALAGGRGRLR